MRAKQPDSPHFEPLRCVNCGGLVPLLAGDATDCPYCSKRVEIPAAYRELRDAEARRVASDTAARSLYAQLARRPAWILRAIAGWFSASALALGVYPATTLLGAAAVGGVQSAVLWFASRRPTENLVDTGTSAFVQSVAGISAWYMVVLGLVFAYAGSILGVYGRKRTISQLGLQNALAARAAHTASGSSECRICGAPLIAKDDEIGVACQYCRADNLLIAPPPLLKAMNAETLRVARATHSAQQALTVERARTRSALRRYIFWLSVVTPIWVFLLGRTMGHPFPFQPTLDDWPPSYALYRRGGAPMVVEHLMTSKPGNLFDYPKGRRWTAPAHCAPEQTLIETALPSTLCGLETCEFRYYAPLARGDMLALVATAVPDGATARIEQHVGSAWETDDYGKQSPAPFGPAVIQGPLPSHGRVQLWPKSNAWYRILVRVPYLLPDANIATMNQPRRIAVCIEINAAR